MAELPLKLDGRRRFSRSVAQLVEHRSPKPGVAGSSPAGPVSQSLRSCFQARQCLALERRFLPGL